MNKKEEQLIRILLEKKKPVSSAALAGEIQVSPRSIKNYVRQINHMSQEPLILSSHNGYEINSAQARSLLSDTNTEEKIPENVEQRAFYIVKEMTLRHLGSISMFDLCDKLAISYATLKSLISRMNKMFSAYDIEFTTKNDYLYVEGTEANKRRMINFVIHEETSNGVLNTDLIQQTFPKISISKLRSILLKTFKSHGFYMNDFALINILVHLAIILDRQKSGKPLSTGQPDFKPDNPQEEEMLEDLVSQLERAFSVSFNPYERFEVYMLFKSNANMYLESVQENLNRVVGEEIIDLNEDIISDINEKYMVNLSNPSFTGPFSLHLKNLLLRLSTGRMIPNPMTASIKESNPIVFDIAAYVGMKIKGRYGMQISLDETAFIALHVGAELERQELSKQKAPVVLLCPQYYDVADNIYNTLMLNFGNQVNMVAVVSDESQLQRVLNEYMVSVIWTLLPLEKDYPECRVVQLPPFHLSSMFGEIQQVLQESSSAFNNQILKDNFSHFFDPDLFYVNPRFEDKDALLHWMCGRLLDKGYIEAGFVENVLKREQAATTSFGHIAIPHSVNMDAIKTTISVALFPQGITWGNRLVYVVFLLSLNKTDQRKFRYLYESLVDLFSEEAVVLQARSLLSFGGFKNMIYSNLES